MTTARTLCAQQRRRTAREAGLRRRNGGFTLLELMVVLAVLVAVAATTIALVSDAGDQADDALVTAEIRQVAEAIARFHRDTGYFPRLGPFSTQDECVGGTGPTCTGGAITAIPTVELQSPANFGQLFGEPLINNGTGTLVSIMAWNPDTSRGWRGPYLDSFGEGTVSVGEDLGSDAGGLPTSGTAQRVTAVADPFDAVPEAPYYEWEEPISGEAVDSRGRPFLFFVDIGAEANLTGCLVPCLVSMGPNRVYDAGGGDDIILNISAAGD